MMTLVSRREGWYGNAERKYGSESRSVITGTVRRNAICSSIFFILFLFLFSLGFQSISLFSHSGVWLASPGLSPCISDDSCGFSGVLSHTV